MHTRWSILGVLVVLCAWPASGRGQQETGKSSVSERVRIGAVAYAPSTVTVFQDLCRYLNQHEFPADYVLYSNYDTLVAALGKGEVDIAWNTPLAHAQFHVNNRCSSQTLVMRDVDRNVRSVLLVRADAGIDSLDALSGKRMVLGSRDAAEATVLPLYFLAHEGLDLNSVEFIRLDDDVDFKGNPCASPHHVLAALREGRGDAGIITADLWSHIQGSSGEDLRLNCIWTSPPFSHCVFTASASFDKQLAERFTKLMTAMDPHDPATADAMRLEGTKKWLPGSHDGFESLVQALSSGK
jgi:ABC-type phosphate/phosphonate transport system substrate-binding protein